MLDIVLSGKFGRLGVGEPITLADRKLAKKLLTELGLERRADYTFDMLSKGERQNVLIARALFPKRKYWSWMTLYGTGYLPSGISFPDVGTAL